MNKKQSSAQRPPNIMHEMLRSFVTLAKFLNLTHAVNHLGSTRQTVRRHIEMLQALRGETLLAFVDRQYVLTREGELALVEAEQILQLDDAWMRKEVRGISADPARGCKAENTWFRNAFRAHAASQITAGQRPKEC